MNVASLLQDQAKLLPDKTAIVFQGSKTTFKQLDETINRFAHHFLKNGIHRGDKVLVFITPSVEFPAVTFALFKLGAIPVFIDSGMGIKNLLNAVEEVEPQAVVAIAKAYILAQVFRGKFRTVKTKVLSASLLKKAANEPTTFEMVDFEADEMGAILFTSGGTGTPKGVVYTHNMLITQTRLLQAMFSLTSDDRDFPCFSLFSFFTIAMGMTSFIPPMDPSKPATADPAKLVEAIIACNATFVAGSPAIWMKVADYCLTHAINLPSVKHVVMFGAPVQAAMHEKWQQILPNGTTYTPYGATEALPITNVSGRELLEVNAQETSVGQGTCVGKPIEAVEVRILNTDELAVSGAVVSREYYNNDAANRESKVTLDGKLWHLIGDVGTIDDAGNIWFWGRKAHVIEVDGKRLYPVRLEDRFNRHPAIKRCALVGPAIDGRVVPTLVIERNDRNVVMSDAFLGELNDIRDSYEPSRVIEKFCLKDSFPVDVRHNIKIDRLLLSTWVEETQGNS